MAEDLTTKIDEEEMIPLQEEGDKKPLGYVFGRPTLYTEDMCDKVVEYLNQCNDEWTEYHKTRGDKSDSYERILKVNLPSREGFARYIGVVVNTLKNWAEEHEDFLTALEVIDQEQKDRLFNEGLAGNYNPIIAKLGLSANHGMKERSDHTTDDDKITSIQVEIVKNKE